MLVWNAISSMVLMIFATLLLDSLIALIEFTISRSALFEAVTCCATSVTSVVACEAFSALRRVIEAISSIEAEVSSSDAACSVAPRDSI